MNSAQHFTGFPEEGLQFLRDLANNNHRDWFETHKPAYQKFLLEPAQAFIDALGNKLSALAPAIHCDTRTDGTGVLMRIYRDVRFSQDKSPYKTNISGLFWEGRKKTESPAFGFMLEAHGMSLMAGQFKFSKTALEAYRNAVIDKQFGSELERHLQSLGESGQYNMVEAHYKRVPVGYPADHPRAHLLLYDALYVTPSTISVEKVITRELVDICFNHFQKMLPIQQWLVKALHPSKPLRKGRRVSTMLLSDL